MVEFIQHDPLVLGGVLAFGDVANDADTIERGSGLVLDGRRFQLNSHDRAILADEPLFMRVNTKLALHLSTKQIQVARPILGVGDLRKQAGEQFVSAVSGERAEVPVHAPVASARVNLRDPDKGVFVSGVEALRALAVLLFSALAFGGVAQKTYEERGAMNRDGNDGCFDANPHAV